MDLCIGSYRPQYTAAPLIPVAFQQQATACPNQPCLVSEGGSHLTFAQAEAAATVLARRLVAAGVGRDVAVGILLDRSPAVVVSMLAVHKAGGCYVPLDPTFPADRLSIYLEDSQAVALITQHSNATLAESLIADLPCMPQVVLYDAPAAAGAVLGSLPDLSTLQPSDLAYIMFTSGSTGRPKGVMVTHGGVRDLVAFNIERFALGPQDVFCLNSTVGFDSYVTYVFASLSTGAKLVVPGPTAHLDPTGMAQLIATHGITTMEVVPALASEYMAAFREAGDRLACLTRFLTGGEALTPKLAEEIVTTLPGLKHGGLFNSYGPTEVTVTTITGHVTAPFDHITMGLPDYNVHTYVVIAEEGADPATAPHLFRLAAVGEPGELWLSGPRLARGYRNRPDLTAKAFVPNPFFAAATASLPADAEVLRPHYQLAYRTGDLVQMNKDGTIDFLGRVDRQVKVNGVRMEVGEIENVLAGAPGVTHAAVKPWKDAAGAYRLVGYVAPDSVDLSATDSYLRSKLLPAMVPSKLVALEHMPRLPNGKIDVKALEEPAWGPAAAAAAEDASDCDQGPAASPGTPLEHIMAETWAEVLHVPVDKISISANFFQMGGSSLRAGLINSKIRRMTQFDISGLLIYQHPTIRSMCVAIEQQYGTYNPNGSSCSSGREDDTSSSDQDSSKPSRSSSFTSNDVAITVMEQPQPGKASNKAKQQPAAAAAEEDIKGCSLPLWLATLLQFMGMGLLGGAAYALFFPTQLVLLYLFGYRNAPQWVLAVASPVLLLTAVVFAVCFAILSKWLLLGRVRPGRYHVWSFFHIRWLIVRMIVKVTLGPIFPLVRATPLINWFFRALGAKIGKHVMIDSANIADWDMLEIGDDVAIEADCFIVGNHIHAGSDSSNSRGTLTFAKTTISSGCTIMAQSVVSAGSTLPANTILTPGTCSAWPPAGPSDHEAHQAVRTEARPLPAALWVSSTALLTIIFSFMWLAIVPTVGLWYWLNTGAHGDWRGVLAAGLDCWLRNGVQGSGICRQLWWTEVVSFLLLPVSSLLMSSVYMWALVPVKWLLVGRITAHKMEKAGLWTHFRLHIWRSLVRGPFTGVTFLWTSTEVFNIWLRAMGAKIGRQCWLSEQFACSEFELYEVGDTASVCSVVSVVGSTNRHTKPIKLGEACDVTNECTLLPGCTVGKGAVLGVFTYGRPDQSFADYSITLGDFTLRNGTSGNDIESGADASEQQESAATRLIPTWQYVLYHVLYVPFSMTIFTLTTAAVILPPILVPLSVLYNFGWWVSILASGLYGPLSFLILLAYLAVMKRLVMPHMAGEYPIFKSFKAAKWQMLALNAHIYEDFAPIMGSVFYNMYLRAMGTKVGRGVACMGAVAAEYEQVSIGAGSVINEGSFLLTHTVENRRAKIRPVSIGQNVTVGALCAVLPEAVMADGAVLADMSLVMKGETVPKNGTWAGVPACAAAKGSLYPCMK